MRKFKIPHKFELVTILELYYQWMCEGKLKLDAEWNRDLRVKFTLQDPCNIIRKTLGEDGAARIRSVVQAMVGQENFVDMSPCGTNNYCCGGGGGALQAGFPEQRRAYGRIKFDQIMATGADYVLAPCHNCHSQMEDLCKHYGGNYHVAHIWTTMCLSMGMLAESERKYLGPDLQDFGL